MRAATSAATCSFFLRSGRAARTTKMTQKRSISAYSGYLDVKELGIKDCVLIDVADGSGQLDVCSFQHLLKAVKLSCSFSDKALSVTNK
ncbi:hypothetical protein ACTQ5A_10735, partial [Bacillota bacterium LCP21S3_F9]